MKSGKSRLEEVLQTCVLHPATFRKITSSYYSSHKFPHYFIDFQDVHVMLRISFKITITQPMESIAA